MVEAEKSTKPLPMDDLPGAVHGLAGRDQGVVDSLMVPLVMMVLRELGDRSSEMGFALWHYSVQALGPDGELFTPSVSTVSTRPTAMARV
jgi:hypothetical protein